ncbi:hypothetical protein [Deefgea tanakiae]|nr:hypothetical protein [Deefgea tanakiae]
MLEPWALVAKQDAHWQLGPQADAVYVLLDEIAPSPPTMRPPQL